MIEDKKHFVNTINFVGNNINANTLTKYGKKIVGEYYDIFLQERGEYEIDNFVMRLYDIQDYREKEEFNEIVDALLNSYSSFKKQVSCYGN